MKIFQTIQAQYAILGVSSSNHSTRKYMFSTRVLFGFLLIGCTIVSHFLYIFYVANDFMKYVASICVASGTTLTFVSLAAIVFRKAQLFGCIDIIEKFIDTSECHFRAQIHVFLDD